MRNSGLVLAVVAVLGAIATAPASATGTGGPADFSAAKSQSTKESRPVLLKFSTEW